MKVFYYVNALLLLIHQCLFFKISNRNARIKKTTNKGALDKLDNLLKLDSATNRDQIIKEYFEIMASNFSSYSIKPDKNIGDNLIENFNYIKTHNENKILKFDLGLTHFSIFSPSDLVESYNHVILGQKLENENFAEREEIKYLFSLIRLNTYKNLINLLKIECKKYYIKAKAKKINFNQVYCELSKDYINEFNEKLYASNNANKQNHENTYKYALESSKELIFSVNASASGIKTSFNATFELKRFYHSINNKYYKYFITDLPYYDSESRAYKNVDYSYNEKDHYQMHWQSFKDIKDYYIPYSTYIYFTNTNDLRNFMNFKAGFFESSKEENEEKIIFKSNIIITDCREEDFFIIAQTSFDPIWGDRGYMKILKKLKNINAGLNSPVLLSKEYNFSLLSNEAIFFEKSSIIMNEFKKNN